MIALRSILAVVFSIAMPTWAFAQSNAPEFAGAEVHRAQRIARAQQALAATHPDEPGVAKQPRATILFRGNRALLDPVLQRGLDLPLVFRPSPEIAQQLEIALESFYHETGYDLARVRATIQDDHIVIYISEGRLNKVAFKGVGSVRALDLRFDFRLPADTYNRFWVISEFERLTEKYGFSKIKGQLVERRAPREPNTRLRKLLPGLRQSELDDAILADLEGEYELIVYVEESRAEPGTGFGIEIILPYGLVGFIDHRRYDTVFDHDRMRISAQLSGSATDAFTKVSAEFSYVFPPLIGEWFRPNLRASSSLTDLARADIGLESYFLTTATVSGRAGVEPIDNLLISGGLGVRSDDAFAVVRADNAPEGLSETARTGIFAVVDVDVDFEPSLLRSDQRHQLDLRIIRLGAFDAESPLIMTGQYQKVFHFDTYDDLFLRLQGAAVLGDSSWRDEVAIGSRIMKVVPTNESFAARIGQLGIEYRYSIFRDLLKVNAFVGGTVFDGLDYPGFDRDLTWATNFGPGLSALVLDNFGVDVYYAIGIGEVGEVESAVNLSIRKVY